MKDALSIIENIVGGNGINLDKIQELPEERSLLDLLKDGPPIVEPISEDVLSVIDVDHSYMIDRGFSTEVLKYNHIGYYQGYTTSYDGKEHKSFMRERIIFPVRNIDGELIGFTGRTIEDDEVKRKAQGIPKWLHSGGLHWYKQFPKSYLIYNAHDAKKSPLREDLIIVEGPIDVLRLQNFGIMNVVAIFGTEMNKYQELIIRQIGGRRLIPLFDNDKAGNKARDKIIKRFSKRKDIVSVKLIDLPEGKDPGDLTIEEAKDILHEFIE